MYPWPLRDGTVARVHSDELELVHRTRRDMVEPVIRAALAAAAPGAKVLDLGCNEGLFAHLARAWGAGIVVGCDLREHNIRRAEAIRDHYGIPSSELRFCCADVRALDPAELGCFDVVLVLGLIYHLEDPVGALRIASRLLAPGGLCVVETQLTRQHEPVVHGWGTSSGCEAAEGSFAVRFENEPEHPLASAGGTLSLIPNAAALELAMRIAGLTDVRWLEAAPHHDPQYVTRDRGIAIGRAPERGSGPGREPARSPRDNAADAAQLQAQLNAKAAEAAALAAQLAEAQQLNLRLEGSVTVQLYRKLRQRLYGAIGEHSLLARVLQSSLRLTGRGLLRPRAGASPRTESPAGGARGARERPAVAGSGQTELPLCLVYGSCQAEAIRVLLEASPSFRSEYRTEQIPAVQEIDDATLPKVREAVARASLIVSQKVRDGYHGFPVGSEEMFEFAPSGCRKVSIPALYYDGLFPFQVYVRDGIWVADAPLSVYHDLRFLYCAGQGFSDGEAKRWLRSFEPDREGVRSLADHAQAVLRAHEADLDVRVGDRLLARSTHPRSFFTVNHPTNAALFEVVAGIHQALAVAYVPPRPGGELLGMLRTPVEPSVVEALELDVSPRSSWVIEGQDQPLDALLALHLAWYREHPELVSTGLVEHEARMRALGLAC
jgi:SAM-dependent methyltransferase